MQPQAVTVSARFKQKATGAILSIVLFILVYLLLIAFAIGLTLVCGYLGIQIIIIKPMFLTLMLGLGLASMGFLILIFLFKFITKKSVTDHSHLVPVSEEQEPELFHFINSIAREVNTSLPKKVFLSADVNASVFYDSSFWSMFLPVKKNLQIGLGLVNTVSQSECKAILAHEFGHFSQSSMKVGSYVYNVNRIIYNMLYDNESYISLARSWASASSYIAIFVQIAVKITQGIQWVLQKVYKVVNLNHRGLMREMEFHADAVAASVAGSKPLITSLSRMELADRSYNVVLNYYSNKIEEAVITHNIYPQQQFVLQFLAEEDSLPFENGLPVVNDAYTNKHNKSKLVIKDQWASHPETKDRVEALARLNIVKEHTNDGPANTLFRDISGWETLVTEKLFASVTYKKPVTPFEKADFSAAFTKHYRDNSFSTLFNNYYDNRNPACIAIDDSSIANGLPPTGINELYGDKALELISTHQTLENDIAILQQIAGEQTHIETFDYNGNRYQAKEAGDLANALQTQLQQLQTSIEENDIRIYKYFRSLAIRQGSIQQLTQKYQAFIVQETGYEEKMQAARKVAEACRFIEQTTPIEVIEKNLFALQPLEETFRKYIKELIHSEAAQAELTDSIRQTLTQYLRSNEAYFIRPNYNDAALNGLFSAINAYQFLLSKTFFIIKKELLDCFETLYNHIEQPAVTEA